MRTITILIFFHFHNQHPLTNCYNFETINLTDYSSTIKCVNKITAKYYGPDTIFSYDQKSNQLGEDFLKSFQNFPVALSHEKKYNEQHYHPPNYIVISNNATYIKNFLKENRGHFNSKTAESGDKHIFVELEHHSSEIVKIMYDLLIVKFVIVTKDSEVLWYDAVEERNWFPDCTLNYVRLEQDIKRKGNCRIEEVVSNNP